MNYKFCIGNPHDGSVTKEFVSLKAREQYIEYLQTLGEEWYSFWEWHCRATCLPGDEWVLNFHKGLWE